jgi:hypothetical protein
MSKTLDLFANDAMVRGAQFSGANRHTLTRRWGDGPHVCFIGCNPSTADHRQDDPTCRWWIKWSRRFGFGGFVAVNLYPFCSSSPAKCRAMADWQENGPDWYARDAINANLDVVVREAKAAHRVVACWGAIAWDDAWIDHVVESIQTGEEPWPDIYCFGKTSLGAPKHPMARGVHRIPPDQPLLMWSAAA